MNGLEAAFPATVSTIIRTAGKLGLRSSHELAREGVEDPAARSGGECPLCGLYVGPSGSEEDADTLLAIDHHKPAAQNGVGQIRFLPSSTRAPLQLATILRSQRPTRRTQHQQRCSATVV